MKLFRKIITVIAVILLYSPITSNAGFLVKKSSLQTVQTASTTENGNIITTKNTAHCTSFTENTVVHKKSFFGKIAQKFTDAKNVFTAAGKKKIVAILLGLLDLFIIGPIGLPRFYMGYTAEGLMQLIFYLLGGVGIVCVILAWGLGETALLIPGFIFIGLCVFSMIWQIVDIIRIICNDLKPKDGYWDE
jgi:hypothetical protein